MEKSEEENKNPFCVVHFIEPPFENIDDYVCVPSSWIILGSSTDSRIVIVSYPNTEDHFKIRNRVKNKERFSDSWNIYKAILEYHSDSYQDVEYWIATKNNYKLVEEEMNSDTEDPLPEPEPVLDRKLRSTTQYLSASRNKDKSQLSIKSSENCQKTMEKRTVKQSGELEPKRDLGKKKSKSDKFHKSTKVIMSPKKMAIEHFKKKYTTRSVEAKEAVASSSDKNRTERTAKSQHAQKDKSVEKSGSSSIIDPTQLSERRSSPIPQVGEKKSRDPNLDIDDKTQSERVKRRRLSFDQTYRYTSEEPSQPEPTEGNDYLRDPLEDLLREQYRKEVTVKHPRESNASNQKTDLHFDTTTAQGTESKPSTITSQLPQSSQHTPVSFATTSGQSYSVSKPREIHGERSSVSHENQRLHQNNPAPALQRIPSSVKISNQVYRYKSTQSSQPIIENPVTKKIHPGNVTNVVITSQNLLIPISQSSPLYTYPLERQIQSLQQDVPREPEIHDRYTVKGNSSDPRSLLRTAATSSQKDHQNIVHNTSAAQSLSELAHQSRYIFHRPEERYLPYPEHNLRQIPQVRDTSRIPIENRGTLQSSNFSDYNLSQVYASQNQINSMNQPSGSRPQSENRRVSGQQLRRFTESYHTGDRVSPQNIAMSLPSAARSSNQFSESLEFPQRDPRSSRIHLGISTQSKNPSPSPIRQGVPKKSSSLPFLPKISSSARESILTTQRNTTDRLRETQHSSVFKNQTHRNPKTLKLMVDQSTETSLTATHVSSEDNIVRPFAAEGSSMVMDNMCQTDEYWQEELASVNQNSDPDFVTATSQEIVSDDKISTEEIPVEVVSDDDGAAENIPADNSSARPIPEQVSASARQKHPRIIAEQRMLYEVANLFTQMGTTMNHTCDMFKDLRSSFLQSAKTYKRLIKAVQTFNDLGNSLSAVSPSYNVISESLPTTEEIRTEEEAKDNPSNDNVNEEPSQNRDISCPLDFPPEYDPHDSKWTLKHRKSSPELEELLPSSDIYVNSLDLQRCKWLSKDCKSLAKLLLTEVFSISALSVCSLMGEKTEAPNNLDDTRPRLDDWARMVLLKFVEKFGIQRGWDTSNTQDVISSLRDKIYEIRANYGQTTR